MSVSIKKLMQFAVDNKASDIHISVGRPATFRINGGLKPLKTPPLTPADSISIFKEIAPEKNVKELQDVGSTDFAYAYEDKCRFRCAALKSKGVVGVVLRLIPSELLSFEQIGLPEAFRQVLDRPRGLVLVTGPTGSGKTTTLATCLDYLNTNFDHHIVTVEDPIEFYHPHRKSIVTQREVGSDVPTFAEGLRRALRQDPDVVLVGEMRDLVTIQAAITAAETGHLVLGTLHTTGATRTIDRIIDAFPTDQQSQVRSQLAVSLVGVVSQLLLPKVGGGRVAAFEILLGTSAVENLIREGKTYQLSSVMQTSRNLGMATLDDYLWDLWLAQKITRIDMIRKCQDTKDINNRLRDLRDRGSRGWDDHINYEEISFMESAAEYATQMSKGGASGSSGGKTSK